ncbi:MAG: sulfur oxidation c-type cytochrome SoxX [Pseudomonadota bacterium]
MKHFAIAFVATCFAAEAGLSEEIAPEDVIITDDFTVVERLTETPGKPFRGLEVFIDRKRGNCVACHTNFDVEAMQFLGEIGPSLDWIGDRMKPEEIRAILVDPKRVFGEQTIMPAFYTTEHGARTLEEFKGKPILTAQEIEDVVAYLSELRH